MPAYYNQGEMKKNYLTAMIGLAEERKERDALGYKNIDTDKWEAYSWSDFAENVKKISLALIAAGLKWQENVGIFSQNSAEWITADLGIIYAGSVSVPIYATNTTSQAKYIIDEAGIRFLFVGDEDQYHKALEVYSSEGSTLEKIIVFKEGIGKDHENTLTFSEFLQKASQEKKGALEERTDKISKDDLATIIYTSGTTGEPKGVMLSHGNFNHAFRIHDMRLNIEKGDHSLAFLPLSHIFERAWSLYALYKGVKVSFLTDPKKVIETLGEVRPSVMCSVPRLYQKAYHTIRARIQQSSAIRRFLFNAAVNSGKRIAEYNRKGENIPFQHKVIHNFLDNLVLKKIRSFFGGNLKFMPCAGAPLSAEITEFFHAIGMPVLIGYGLTETCATVSVFPEKGYKFGSAGTVMPEVELKIGRENEIWVKGATLMKGYYKKPEETARVFEGEWLRTGDAGSFDDEGHLYITDRIKDLMKTSYGKYVAPQPVESLLTNDNYIENAILIGDDKPYITALLVPNFEALQELAHNLNVTYHNLEDLVKKSSIIEFYESKLDQLQQSLAHFEKVKKFKLLPHDFNMQIGELTPTLKVRRQVVIQHFNHLIDEMYAFA